MGMRMMSFIPFPPQMIDWASARASIPEEENYRIWDICAYKKMKHNVANCTAFWCRIIQWLKGIMDFMLAFQHFHRKISIEIAM